MQSLPSTGYLRQSQIVGNLVPVGSSTLWRWIKAGQFPQPFKLGPGVTAWRVEDVRAWLDERARVSA